MAKIKSFSKIFRFFLNRKSNFVLKEIFSKKKNCRQNLMFGMQKVVRDTLMLNCFPFCVIKNFVWYLYAYHDHILCIANAIPFICE